MMRIQEIIDTKRASYKQSIEKGLIQEKPPIIAQTVGYEEWLET